MKRKARIREWAELYKKQFYMVHANLEGWGNPTVIRGNRPDIMASRILQRIVVQVETHETIDTPEAQEKKKIFEEWAKSTPDRKFIIDIV